VTNEAHQQLIEKLNEVRQRLQHIQAKNQTISEADTKAGLIEPVINSLGWDTLDFEEVNREYRHKSQDNPVDYALFVHRSPILFVEAKGLRENMNDRKWITQTVNYANTVGVKWCVLTNGDEYRLYNSHAECDVEEKLFSSIRISDPSVSDIIETLELLSKERMSEKKLDVLWKSHFIDRHVKVALQDLLKGDEPALIRLIRKATPELSPSEIKDSLKRADIGVEYPTIVSPAGSVVSTARSIAIVAQVGEANESKLPQRKAKKVKSSVKKSPDFIGVDVIDLIRAGLIEPPAKIEKEYKEHHLEATILEDGRISFGDEVYDSVSTSAAMARKSIIGSMPGRPYPQTNGWQFWKILNSTTGKLEEIDTIRQQFLKRRA
jgi:hypothetical protein